MRRAANSGSGVEQAHFSTPGRVMISLRRDDTENFVNKNIQKVSTMTFPIKTVNQTRKMVSELLLVSLRSVTTIFCSRTE